MLILSQDDCFNKSIHEIVSGGRGCEGVGVCSSEIYSELGGVLLL